MKEFKQIQATYIHTPFCVQKCLYCDFASYACRDTNIMKEYANAVCREIAQGGAVKLPINPNATIYFGGGTPSTLPIECIAQIVDALNEIPKLYYRGMKIWADQSVKLFPYGYPFDFVANQIHQYILIFRKY